MKNKTTKNKEVELTIIEEEKWINCEWCFQFDDSEPHVFAWTDDEIESDENPKITFEINNTKNAYINFTHPESGKRFKLFSRELTDMGRKLRDISKEKIQNFKNISNDSEDKEA